MNQKPTSTSGSTVQSTKIILALNALREEAATQENNEHVVGAIDSFKYTLDAEALGKFYELVIGYATKAEIPHRVEQKIEPTAAATPAIDADACSVRRRRDGTWAIYQRGRMIQRGFPARYLALRFLNRYTGKT